MGFAARRHFRCLTFEPIPQGPQDVVFRASFRTKCCQPPHLSPAWRKTKVTVWNTSGFDTRELEWAPEDWVGPKEDTALPSWCSADEQQVREGGSRTVPCPASVLPCQRGFVRCYAGAPVFFCFSKANSCCLAGRVWAILGANVTAFCPGVWGKFCYTGGIKVKITW